ncbi:uncharacterized protein EI90DRAFT_786780 [Cantharellus anzutake]|uniref:uncharacterized protein n=1 Tax=Cantharellus anzutake TaxID=1750568 RepID=UPI0019042B08|nr:uncharacterized protein EI90DRAFT_786780 [Cantharellus anzutake]KAF8342779.1 hypothetical protein EI90DRAFT_786780 [Cantharellus anzutake]
MNVHTSTGLPKLKNQSIHFSASPLNRPSRFRTLSSQSKPGIRARLSSLHSLRPSLNVRVCLHRGETPSLQLLSSRVARLVKLTRAELKLDKKSPARFLELARAQRRLKNRVAMITRQLAHVMEETKESFARIRLESVCRSKLNAENSLRRLAKLKAVAEAEHELNCKRLRESLPYCVQRTPC